MPPAKIVFGVLAGCLVSLGVALEPAVFLGSALVCALASIDCIVNE